MKRLLVCFSFMCLSALLSCNGSNIKSSNRQEINQTYHQKSPEELKKEKYIQKLTNNELKLKELVDKLNLIESSSQVSQSDIFSVVSIKQQILRYMDDGISISKQMDDTDLANEYTRRKQTFIEAFKRLRY